MLSPKSLLVFEALFVAGLSCGAFLARRKRYKVHGVVQTAVVTANLVVVGLAMVPSLHRQIGAGRPPTLVWIHAGAGALALLISVYVVVSAVFGWLRNFRPWMRTALALWWAAFLLGGGVYYVTNVESASVPSGQAPKGQAPTAPAQPAVFQVTIQNFAFQPSELVVPAGAEVQWTDLRGRHSVQADDGSFKSEALTADGTYKHRFDQPGRYPYFCEFHGSAGGHDMAGAIVVQSR
jgi:plastocyanin